MPASWTSITAFYGRGAAGAAVRAGVQVWARVCRMKATELFAPMPLSRWRQNVIINERPWLTAARAATWLVHNLARRRATIQLWPDGPLMRLEPQLRAYGSTSLYMKRLEYEPELKVLADLTRAGDVVLDIGANYGVYALTLATRVQPGGSVQAFEPGIEALRQLRHNSEELNAQLPISIWPIALSDEKKTMALYHLGAPTTFTLAGTGDETSESVEALTLDEWVTTQCLDRVDIIKIDVEGHEPKVFTGAHATLTKFRPVIMFEVSTSALSRAGCSQQAPFEFLTGIGYRVYVLRDGCLQRIDRVEDGNLFAFHPEGRGSAQGP